LPGLLKHYPEKRTGVIASEAKQSRLKSPMLLWIATADEVSLAMTPMPIL
jgi:hypothetical protein